MRSRLVSMLITGFALALGLLIAVQITGSLRSDGPDVPDPEIQPQDLNKTIVPVIFKDITETDGELRLSGTSEPNAVISVRNGDENLRQMKASKDGTWTTALSIEETEVLAIELLSFVDNGAKVRSDETLYRIPAPRRVLEYETDVRPPSLILITAPGGPSRIIQSPFRGLPTNGPLSMGPIDHDESGSVIFSGVASQPGLVRIFAVDRLIGESGVGPDGRWFFIAAETLPVGEYDIRVQLVSGPDATAEVTVPFVRVRAQNNPISNDPVSVTFEPYRWQISRNLYGGGQQHTSIFAPQEAEPIVIAD